MAAKNNALNKPVNLSPELEGVVGKGPLTRAQVTSKVWDHIKANTLQDSKDKRMINPDAKLGAVIGPARTRAGRFTNTKFSRCGTEPLFRSVFVWHLQGAS